MDVGIDAIGFNTPNLCLDLKDLAQARGVDVSKFHNGLGQLKMSIATHDEDIVTMGADAAQRIINDSNRGSIDAVLFATESGVDQSKSAGLFLHGMLNLNQNCRVVEIKQSCYGGIGAIQFAISLIKSNMSRKVLVISSDVSRYGLNSKGESSQGAGAVAMILSQSPRILVIEEGSGLYVEDNMDFWRPNYMQEAIVYGRHSCDLYLKFLYHAWDAYYKNTLRKLSDHDYFCYHVAIPELVRKSHISLSKRIYGEGVDIEKLHAQISDSLIYGKLLGNCYVASVKIALISLLDKCKDNLENKRVGFYSYGSGSIAEFFSAIICKGYKEFLDSEYNESIINNRKCLSIDEYEEIYSYKYPTDASTYIPLHNKVGYYRLSAIKNHARIYEKCR